MGPGPSGITSVPLSESKPATLARAQASRSLAAAAVSWSSICVIRVFMAVR